MSVQLTATVPARGLDVALRVSTGHSLALLGPNGSGKSTILAVLAGLLAPATGSVTLEGRTLVDTDPAGGTHAWVPPHRRRVALLAQDPRLFPHLSVVDNVAFGPRAAGRTRQEARDAARSWLTEVGAADLAARSARSLSGGQAQRVALARALAAEPALLLLDEPLASLDVDVAASVRTTLARVLTGRTTILVTHDVLDVALLCDDVVVLAGGEVAEAGPAQQIMRTPGSQFAARLFGLNMVSGTAIGPRSLRSCEGWAIHGQADPLLAIGGSALAVFQPAAVSVHVDPPTGSPRTTISGTITGIEPSAHLVRVRVGALKADITPASVAALQLRVGVPVYLAVKAAEVTLYEAPLRPGPPGSGAH